MKEAMKITNGISDYLERSAEAMEQFLKYLVSLETPSRNKERQHVLFDFLKSEFEKLDYHVVHFDGKKTGGFLYARPAVRDKSLPLQLMVGHGDTVWPLNTLDNMPIKDEGGMLKGPGVFDMKAGITQIIFALRAIRELDLSINVVPVILINSDEEIGSFESTTAISRLARVVNRAYVLEPPLGLDGKLKTARKGIGQFTIMVEGRAAHAGLDPTKGINAIVELSHQVQKLYAMNDLENGITVNVGMIEGGISANVIAPQSKAVVDVRVLSEEDGKAITEKILSLKPHLDDVTLKIEGGIGRPPMERTEANQRLWKMAKTEGKKLGITLEEVTAGGGSDANTTSQFTATLDGLGTPGDGAHAIHEYIIKNELQERTALLALLILAEPIKNKP